MGRTFLGVWLSTTSARRAMLAAAMSLASLPSFATGVSTTGDPLEYLEFFLSEQSAGGIWEDAMATSDKDPTGKIYPRGLNDSFDEFSVLHETYRFGEFDRGLISAYASRSGTFWAETRGARGFQGYAEGGIEYWFLKTAPDAKISMVVTGGELLIGGNFDPDVPLFAQVYLEGVLTRYVPGGGLSEVRTYGHKVRLCGAGGTFASETYGTCVNGGDLPAENVIYTESNLLALKLDTVYQAKVEILPSVIDIDLSGVAINEQFFFDVSAFVSTVIPLDVPEAYAYAYLRDPLELGNEDDIGSGIQFSGLIALSPPIPEPGTATLFLLGAALMGTWAFRRSACHPARAQKGV